MNAVDVLNKIQKKRQTRQAQEQLPLWSDRVRALPNPLARCALFTASSSKIKRELYEYREIVSIQSQVIRYSGSELRQDDQDVFLQIVHLGSQSRCYAGDWFTASAHQILVALGWGRGGERYDRLQKTIRRLVEGTIWVSVSDNVGYSGRLIDNVEWQNNSGDGSTSLWRFRLDPRIVDLFGNDAHSLIEWEKRLKLGDLEKWLHSFYVTHQAPYSYNVETLYRLCGSKVKHLRQFRFMLNKALGGLKEDGFLESFTIDAGGLVTVRRRFANALPA